MKTNLKLTTALAGLLALGSTALVAQPQDNGGPQDGPGPGGPAGPGLRGERPPAPAIVRVLDANHDGVIDAQEIANAPAALRSLDKNGDGKLTRDEFIGQRPPPPQNGNGGDAGGPPMGDGNNPPPGPPPGDH